MIKRILKVLLVLVICVSVLPYLIPIPKPDGSQVKPFENSSYTSIEDVSLHYRVWEPTVLPENPVMKKILLVHGLAGSTFSFRQNIDALLQEGYLVVAVDLPGFGYSDRTRGISHSQENRAQLIWKFLSKIDQEYKNEGKWNLLGHSMGAGTITAMALSEQNRVAKLIYVDGAVLPDKTRNSLLLSYPPVQRWFQVLGRYVLLKEDRMGKLLESAYGRPVTAEEVKGYLDPLKRPGSEGAFIDMIMSSTQIDESRLKEISVPVIGIWGEKDTWVSVQNGYKLEKMMPNFKLYVIDGAGHCSMETHWQEFDKILVDGL